jgi:hypothetical protein
MKKNDLHFLSLNESYYAVYGFLYCVFNFYFFYVTYYDSDVQKDEVK